MPKNKTKKDVDMQQSYEEASMRLQTEYVNRMADILGGLPGFAKDSDEGEWKSLNEVGKLSEYTEQGISDMQETASKLYYEDPMARCVIDTMVNFVVGRDASITPVSTDPKVKKFWDKFVEVNNFDMKVKELAKRCFRDGESFIRFFKSRDGSGIPLIRFVEPSDVSDESGSHSFGIETVPGDVETSVNYCLKGGKKKVPAGEMVHTKINVDSNVKRGISFLVGIAKYIVKYGLWLDDRIMLNKVRMMFAVIAEVSGISPSSFKGKLADSTKLDSLNNPKKKGIDPGSILVTTPGIKWKMEGLNIHAPDTAADGRLIELQAAKGANLTEYVVRADSSNSNYSSTMVSESPMVRNFEAWQDVFEKPLKIIYRMVIEYGIKSRKLPRNTDTACEVNFAGLIHRDIKLETEAYILQNQAGIVSKKTIRERLGYDNEEEKKRIAAEQKEESDQNFNEQNDEDEDQDQQ